MEREKAQGLENNKYWRNEETEEILNNEELISTGFHFKKITTRPYATRQFTK